jgi:hypothetical protein
MTSKQRAEQLYNRMTIDFLIDKQQTKICSLICVEEILDEISNYCESIEQIEKANDFYSEVLTELHKL